VRSHKISRRSAVDQQYLMRGMRDKRSQRSLTASQVLSQRQLSHHFALHLVVSPAQPGNWSQTSQMWPATPCSPQHAPALPARHAATMQGNNIRGSRFLSKIFLVLLSALVLLFFCLCSPFAVHRNVETLENETVASPCRSGGRATPASVDTGSGSSCNVPSPMTRFPRTPLRLPKKTSESWMAPTPPTRRTRRQSLQLCPSCWTASRWLPIHTSSAKDKRATQGATCSLDSRPKKKTRWARSEEIERWRWRQSRCRYRGRQ
jgi:hypothetical protein